MSNLTRWDPWRNALSVREAMDRLLEESFLRSSEGSFLSMGEEGLAVDVYTTDDDVIVKAAVPGVDPEDIDISISGDTLTIRGETRSEEEISEENYLRRECRYGAFRRSLVVPTAVESDQAEAEIENGVLKLTMPKSEQVKPKRIAIKGN